MKKLYKVLIGVTGIGLMTGSCQIGRYIERDCDYRIQRKADQAFLHVTGIDQMYELHRVNDHVYLGGSDHNLQGVREVGQIEGIRSAQPQIDALRNQNEQLEGRISRRKIADQVEDIGGDIKEGWRNFKHNLLE